jgi:hypothetical protein
MTQEKKSQLQKNIQDLDLLKAKDEESKVNEVIMLGILCKELRLTDEDLEAIFMLKQISKKKFNTQKKVLY